MSYQMKDAARYSRAQWMERFESEVLKLRPRMRHRIDFETGEYFYLQGFTPKQAAETWLNGETSK